MTTFQCQRCGTCCKQVGHLIQWIPLMLAAIFKPDASGACQHLRKLEDGTYECVIYEKRPKICRVEWVVKNRARSFGLDEQSMYDLSAHACKLLREENDHDTV